MRPGLLIVLALWVFSVSSSGWGEQGTREEGMSEQGTLLPRKRSLPLLNFVDVKLSHDKQWETKGYLTSDVIKRVREWSFPQDVHVLPSSDHHTLQWSTRSKVSVEGSNLAQHDGIHLWLHNRHVRMLSHSRLWSGKDNVGTDDGTPNEEQCEGLKLHVNLHVKHKRQSLVHQNVWGTMRRMSLLDVVDETTADKQANAVRRQGVDSALLKYAGLTLSADTQTGAVYDVRLPPSLAGIQAQATRIMPSTLEQNPLTLNEFTFPSSTSFSPSSDYVTIVYRKITSFTVYTLPPEYQYGGPVVGIISSSSNSTAVDPSLPPGSVSLPTNTYINISLPMSSTSLDSNGLCAFFASNGSIFVSSLASMPNFCLSSTLGDFALVVRASSMTSPTQNAPPPIAKDSSTDGGVRSSSSSSSGAKSSTNWKLIVGGTCLALAGLAFLVASVLIGLKIMESVKLLFMTRRYTGNDEALQDSLVGGSIAPSAAVMRTKPALEIDVANFSH